jgi:hypothetical protein
LKLLIVSTSYHRKPEKAVYRLKCMTFVRTSIPRYSSGYKLLELHNDLFFRVKPFSTELTEILDFEAETAEEYISTSRVAQVILNIPKLN